LQNLSYPNHRSKTTTTADGKIREIFEPGASAIRDRIHALEVLHSRGVSTFAMIAPILPRALETVAGSPSIEGSEMTAVRKAFLPGLILFL
jgi:hypothetical protein